MVVTYPAVKFNSERTSVVPALNAGVEAGERHQATQLTSIKLEAIVINSVGNNHYETVKKQSSQLFQNARRRAVLPKAVHSDDICHLENVSIQYCQRWNGDHTNT